MKSLSSVAIDQRLSISFLRLSCFPPLFSFHSFGYSLAQDAPNIQSNRDNNNLTLYNTNKPNNYSRALLFSSSNTKDRKPLRKRIPNNRHLPPSSFSNQNNFWQATPRSPNLPFANNARKRFYNLSSKPGDNLN